MTNITRLGYRLDSVCGCWSQITDSTNYTIIVQLITLEIYRPRARSSFVQSEVETMVDCVKKLSTS